MFFTGRKNPQGNFITVLNADNSVSLLSTRKGKTARTAGNGTVTEEDGGSKAKLKVQISDIHDVRMTFMMS